MTTEVTLYKVLDDDLRAMHGGRYTYTPGEWTPWVDPVMCQTGYHICRGAAHLLHWLGPQIWGVETRGEVVEGNNKVCAESIRLVARVETWTDVTARLFVADCAAHVSHLLTDNRSRNAIVAARQFARGLISADELAAARAAAWAAGWDTWAAGWDTWASARASYARDAAWASARASAWASARASYARDAAWASARASAWASARASAAAQGPVGAAERSWQVNRLRAYLRGDELTDVPIVGGMR